MNGLVKQSVRNVFRYFGYDIVGFRRGQTGNDPLDDMAGFLHHDQLIIFDVGANIGQSIAKFRSRFPDSIIHSFEPSPETFRVLQRAYSDAAKVHLWNRALGSKLGRLTLKENVHSDMSSFLELDSSGLGKVVGETLVDVSTVDDVVKDGRITTIDILKIDTQGFEFEVLKGAEQALSDGRVNLVYLELIFSNMYKSLPSYIELLQYLADHEFVLVSIYKIRYHLRLASWTDALFVHKSLI